MNMVDCEFGPLRTFQERHNDKVDFGMLIVSLRALYVVCTGPHRNKAERFVSHCSDRRVVVTVFGVSLLRALALSLPRPLVTCAQTSRRC